jgi:hypothetical protein
LTPKVLDLAWSGYFGDERPAGREGEEGEKGDSEDNPVE